MPRSFLAESAIKIRKRKRKEDKISHWLTVEKKGNNEKLCTMPTPDERSIYIVCFFGKSSWQRKTLGRHFEEPKQRCFYDFFYAAPSV